MSAAARARRVCRSAAVVLTVSSLSAITRPAHALDYSWVSPVNGTWTDAARWSPEVVPDGSPDAAFFNHGPSDPAAFAAYPGYTVSIPTDVDLRDVGTGGAVVVGADKVTFTGKRVSAAFVEVGWPAGKVAVANLVDGASLFGYRVGVGVFGGNGTVNVSGPGAALSNGNGMPYSGVYVGTAGSVGGVNLSGGAALTAYDLWIGEGGDGALRATGAGTTIDVTHAILVGGMQTGGVGLLAMTGGATAVSQYGFVVCAGSKVAIDGPATEFRSVRAFHAYGEIDLSDGGSLVTDLGRVDVGAVLRMSGGRLLGSSSTVEGTLTGYGTIAGSLTCGSNATFALCLSSGSAYDRITGIGYLAPAGTLAVTAAPGFAPQPGDAFDLLDFGSLAPGRTFTTVQLPPLPDGLSWDTSALYTTGTILVSTPEPSVPATATLLLAGMLARHRCRRRG